MTSPTPAPSGGDLTDAQDRPGAALTETGPVLGEDARRALIKAKLTGSVVTMSDGYPSFVMTSPEEAADRALAALVPHVAALLAAARPLVLGEEALAEARAEIGAIIATADDGTDMLNEIMAGPVAALLAAARAAERERIARMLDSAANEPRADGRAAAVMSAAARLARGEWDL